ncbi:helix-turn-helix domain-containing protein [Amycolatopsis sp. NPDC003865]
MSDEQAPGQSSRNSLAAGLATLEQLLGRGWTVTQLTVDDSRPAVFDARVQVTPPDSSPYVELLVDVRDGHFSPRDVLERTVPMVNLLRQARANSVLIVISPWLSPRVQEVLREHDIAYLDLTGNVSLTVTYPAIRIYTQGAVRAPKDLSAPSRRITLAGPRAGRIVRFLADYLPPYRASQIADRANVSPPWVSRLLGQLEDQLLIRRDGREIVEVRWPDLLRARAESYSLLRPGGYFPMVAPSGASGVMRLLRDIPPPSGEGDSNIAVTGPYAARAIAPYAVGGQLMLYVDHYPHVVDRWVEQLGLLPVDEGADVLLIQAPDASVFDRYRLVDGVAHVAHSQLVIDSLAGSGRMPAEGEMVLKSMIDDEGWRRPLEP